MGTTWIQQLVIDNVGLIRTAQLDLTPGFNVVTGESGAGKSLLVSALDTALGSRAQADQVGMFGVRARVRVAIAVPPEDAVWADLGALGVESDDMLLIQREWGRDGRGVFRLQGQVVPLGSARAALGGLVDLSGQHEHQQMGEVGYARTWLDAGVDSECLESVARAWSERAALVRERDSLRDQQGHPAVVQEWRDEVARLAALAIDPAADARLAERVARAHAAAQLAAGYQAALDHVEEAVAALAAAERAIGGVVEWDQPAASALGLLSEAAATAGEVRHEVYQRMADVDQGAGEVSAWMERLDRLARARRRYDTDLDGLLAILADRRRALDAVDAAAFRLSRLDAQVAEAEERYEAAAQRLTDERRRAAALAAEAVSAVLPELDLPDAVFVIEVEPGLPGPHGGDVVTWRFSANPGHEPRPVHRVASGGERARLLLALNLVRRTSGPLVFDEVDQGLGGHAAQRVAAVLQELGHRQQLVVVSHQAVVAARAERHWRIVKHQEEEAGSTLVPLAPAERVEEIARMLSGSVTPVALRHAEDLLVATGGGSAD
ncbi:MAG: AAA family ATPase [Thermaerobacter sp.]|nr:AAA family ATPase [Thermaerobacter sp.]